MKRAQHTEHCRQILGEGFPEVHNFLDSFADLRGPDHRKVFHNQDGVKQCIQRWGWLAGAAACIHIWADEEGIIQTETGEFKPAQIINE